MQIPRATSGAGISTLAPLVGGQHKETIDTAPRTSASESRNQFGRPAAGLADCRRRTPIACAQSSRAAAAAASQRTAAPIERRVSPKPTGGRARPRIGLAGAGQINHRRVARENRIRPKASAANTTTTLSCVQSSSTVCLAAIERAYRRRSSVRPPVGPNELRARDKKAALYRRAPGEFLCLAQSLESFPPPWSVLPLLLQLAKLSWKKKRRRNKQKGGKKVCAKSLERNRAASSKRRPRWANNN